MFCFISEPWWKWNTIAAADTLLIGRVGISQNRYIQGVEEDTYCAYRIIVFLHVSSLIYPSKKTIITVGYMFASIQGSYYSYQRLAHELHHKMMQLHKLGIFRACTLLKGCGI